MPDPTVGQGARSDLTEVDRAILRALATHGELLGNYLAELVGVPGKSLGSRMSALVKRGLVKGRRVRNGPNAWELTLRATKEGPWLEEE